MLYDVNGNDGEHGMGLVGWFIVCFCILAIGAWMSVVVMRYMMSHPNVWKLGYL